MLPRDQATHDGSMYSMVLVSPKPGTRALNPAGSWHLPVSSSKCSAILSLQQLNLSVTTVQGTAFNLHEQSILGALTTWQHFIDTHPRSEPVPLCRTRRRIGQWFGQVDLHFDLGTTVSRNKNEWREATAAWFVTSINIPEKSKQNKWQRKEIS